MNTPKSTFGKFLAGLAKLYRGFRSVVLNLLFIFMLLLLLGSMIGQPPVIVPSGGALVINPDGTIVDQLTFVEPLDVLVADSLGSDQTGEVLLQDLLDAINIAATDDDISSIVLALNGLQPSGFSKLGDIAAALDDFRENGKKVYAYADSYSQGQYYLAAHADEVILNTMGSIDLQGFSSYQIYYRDALDKLGVNVHVFRVGEYKSAVEPYERNDMSIEAREANSEWLGDLWNQYVSDVTLARGFEEGWINNFINTLDTQLTEFDGNFARLAQSSNLVDSVMARSEVNEYLISQVGTGANGEDFLSIGYEGFLLARGDAINSLQVSEDAIGIIVAKGTIYDGRRPAGEIGGDTLQELIRMAREDDNVKALVLRIDSGGGSAFASEIIRSELAKLRSEGKPLVVSMGSVAASGGYWIATPADEIWASPGTITGSIGIFGLYPTFENTFGKIGINTDGIGTTALAGAFTPGRNLPELAGNVLQLTLEDGYNRFISLVAESRGMSLEEVDAIARGRVWSGEDALDIGLVDSLGSLEEAVDAAAVLAGLENYDTRLIEQPLTPGQQLIQSLTNSVAVRSVVNKTAGRHLTGMDIAPANVLSGLYRQINEDLQSLIEYNDPNGLYLQCQVCLSSVSP